MTSPSENDVREAEALAEAYRRINEQMDQTIVGQRQVIEELLTVILASGHCLLVGVPGLAKTMMIRTLSKILDLEFSRIQFTPDLMPSDITGTEVIQQDKTTSERRLEFMHGPVFANLILADEINRTPPKTQAALLEAMQERQVTVGGRRHKLPEPFFVLATQNPIEQEGTYPLPEAQLDRFMFQVMVDYPDEAEELAIVLQTTGDEEATTECVLSGEDLQRFQKLTRRIPVAEHVAQFAVALVRRTRPNADDAPDFIRDFVRWGAGPRASRYLVLGAKARAVLHGRHCAALEDIEAVAAPVLRHRILLNFNAEAEGITPDDVISRLVEVEKQSLKASGPAGKLPSVFDGGDKT